MHLNNFLLIALLFTMSGCQFNNKPNKNLQEMEDKELQSGTTNEVESKPLALLLSEKKEAFIKNAPDSKKKIYAEGIEAVVNSGVLDKALNVGDKAINFALKNQNGMVVSLYDELKNGPVILTWYRGGWCPYCNISLHYLQQKLPDFQTAGATLLALTPEVPDSSLNTSEKHSLEFQVLSDADNAIGKQFGIIFKLTPEVAAIYEAAFGMHDYNGNESDELPLAATYVIDRNGIIQYAFLDADYRNRAEPDEIIKSLNIIK